jgi:hypothetical protein
VPKPRHTRINIGPPRVVHTDMEADARTFAIGLRIRHKDAALKITMWSKPEDVLPPDMVRRHGLEFGRLVVAEISQMNHDEVSNFARDFSNRYQANPRQLMHAISQPVPDVFSKEERERHGDTFLGLVISNCCQAMKCLEGEQIAQRTGAASRSQTEIARSTRDISRKQMDISRGTQTQMTSGKFFHANFEALRLTTYHRCYLVESTRRPQT